MEFPYKAPRGKIWKTDSYSEWVLVDDPDYYNYEGEWSPKKRNTNLTPKKKKRKKHKK